MRRMCSWILVLIDVYDEVLMGKDREIIGDSDTLYWDLNTTRIFFNVEFDTCSGILFVCS